MPRPARVLAVSGALVAAGVLVGGTAYAAASRSQSAGGMYYACVNLATGGMRLIDPSTGQACSTAAGPGEEREISWSRSAGERGPQGPAGPRGLRGEAGEDGEGGQLESLQDLEGLRCKSGDETGRVELRVEPPERGSGIQLICMTGDTVTTTRRPPAPPRTMAPPDPIEPTQRPDDAPARDPGGDPGGNPGGGAPGGEPPVPPGGGSLPPQG